MPLSFHSRSFSGGAANSENRRIVYIGTLDRRKGAEDAVRGFLASGLRDWELIFIGTGEDLELKRLYVRAAMQNGGWGGRLFAQALGWMQSNGP